MICRAIALSLAALAALPAAAQEAQPPPSAKEKTPAPKEAQGAPPATTAPGTAAEPTTAAPPTDRPDWKAHVEAVTTFLKAWGHGKLEDAKALAADKVDLKMGGKTYTIDVASGKADAKILLPFRGLSSIREDGKMKGVAVNEIKVSAGGEEKTGKAKVMTDESGGAVKVTSIEVE
jgi:glucose/arabinose dehydrogenase